MQREIRTKLSVYKDYPVSGASRSAGAHISCVAFNLDYIGFHDLSLANEIMELFNKAKKLRSNHGKPNH